MLIDDEQLIDWLKMAPILKKQDGTALSELMSFNYSYFNFP